MNNFYKHKIKVVCDDLMCFPVSPSTLEAMSCSQYDAYAITDPDPEPIKTISYNEWLERKNKLSEILYKNTYCTY